MTAEWIYLSPHYDDIALSCGGLAWEQAHAGNRVSVWTICGGDPPPRAYSAFAASLHTRWQTGEEAVAQRRQEDILSCERMGAAYCHFSLSDCIYRPPEESVPHYYASEEAIFGEIDPAEYPLVQALSQTLLQDIEPGAQVVCPLSLGGHVDHRLTRAAAEQAGLSLLYYADYPYALTHQAHLDQLQRTGWERLNYPLSEAGLLGWCEAVAAHASQISTFWPDLDRMRSAIRDYAHQESGVVLWRTFA